MKTNIIYKGDCVDVMQKEINKGSVDLIFADPPYNLSGNGLSWKGNKTGGDWYMVNEEWDRMSAPEYLKFTRKWIGASFKVLKEGGSIYISCTYHNISEVIMVLKQLNFKINNIITWQKTNAMPNMTRRVFTHSTEFVVWAVKGKKWIFNYDDLKKLNPEKQKDGSLKQMRDVWQLPLVQGKERLKGKDGRAIHPTQKPEEMLKRIILASSNKGDVVLDPFLGSGTTAVVAKKLGRKWIGIETNDKYIRVAEKRIRSNVGEIKQKGDKSQGVNNVDSPDSSNSIAEESSIAARDITTNNFYLAPSDQTLGSREEILSQPKVKDNLNDDQSFICEEIEKLFKKIRGEIFEPRNEYNNGLCLLAKGDFCNFATVIFRIYSPIVECFKNIPDSKFLKDQQQSLYDFDNCLKQILSLHNGEKIEQTANTILSAMEKSVRDLLLILKL